MPEIRSLAVLPLENLSSDVDQEYFSDGMTDTLRTFAKVQCPKSFEAYVGTQYELSKLEVGYLLPSESAWPGYRDVGCYVYRGETRVQGSVKDSRT